MSAASTDRFENGIFWEVYKDLERQFEQFQEFVPYAEKNKKTYSFRLLHIILSVGGYVDSAFKEMAGYPKFSSNSDCKKILKKIADSEANTKAGKAPVTVPISLLLKAFETEYSLSRKNVHFKRLPEREIVTPFSPFNSKTKAPEWWEKYNSLKHNLGDNLEEANLENARNALAGAFLLNAIHTPSVLRLYDYGVMDPLIPTSAKRKKGWQMHIPRTQLEDILSKKRKFSAQTETPIFIYCYDQ